jgi:hypothetical protein
LWPAQQSIGLPISSQDAQILPAIDIDENIPAARKYDKMKVNLQGSVLAAGADGGLDCVRGKIAEAQIKDPLRLSNGEET